MRILAISMNVIAITTITILAAGDPPTLRQPVEVVTYLVFFLTPLASLLVLIDRKQRPTGRPGLISLYFERKALEEQRKIRELKKD